MAVGIIDSLLDVEITNLLLFTFFTNSEVFTLEVIGFSFSGFFSSFGNSLFLSG